MSGGGEAKAGISRERAEGHEFDFGKGDHLRPLAATCSGGHWRPLAATRLAASGCKWLPMRRKCWWPLAATRLAASGCKWLPMRREVAASGCKWLPGVGETIFFTIHPLLGGEHWEFSVACARKIYNILRGRSLGNVKYCTVLISMLREFLLIRHGQYETF